MIPLILQHRVYQKSPYVWKQRPPRLNEFRTITDGRLALTSAVVRKLKPGAGCRIIMGVSEKEGRDCKGL